MPWVFRPKPGDPKGGHIEEAAKGSKAGARTVIGLQYSSSNSAGGTSTGGVMKRILLATSALIGLAVSASADPLSLAPVTIGPSEDTLFVSGAPSEAPLRMPAASRSA
jgi:hypothetical protein